MKKQFCPYCGTKLEAKAQFCKNCGEAIFGDIKETDKTSSEQSFGDNTSERRTVFEGYIHKCPNCGEVLNAFVANCPSCGYEIRGASNSAAVQKFAVKLASAETRQEKIAIIRNFPIPNTKEDILEFMILASANIGNSSEKDVSAAWQSKTEQAYQKAQMTFQDEKEFMRIQNIYSQVRASLIKQNKIEKIQNTGSALSELMPILPNVIVITGWLISIFVLLPLCKLNLDNAGTNGSQLLLMLDFIAGAILIPFAFRCSFTLPKVITSSGLILSIIVLIPLCEKNLDNAGTNAFHLILIVDIICSVVIFVRMFKNKHKSVTPKTTLNKISFVIALICVAIMLAVYGVGSIITAITVAKDNAVNEQEKQQAQSVTYEWPAAGLNQYLPLPPTKYGEIKTDDETRFNMEIYQVSSEDFKGYVKNCEEKGFTISTTKTDSVFYAYNGEQYELDIFYQEDKDSMEIYLDAPLKMTEIKWPDNKLVKQIPKPASLIGNISWETSEHFGVYISNITPEQYSEYVDQCIDAGFTVDYSRGEKTFHAYNIDGYYLVVEQHLFDKIYISIKVPEKD